MSEGGRWGAMGWEFGDVITFSLSFLFPFVLLYILASAKCQQGRGESGESMDSHQQTPSRTFINSTHNSPITTVHPSFQSQDLDISKFEI